MRIGIFRLKRAFDGKSMGIMGRAASMESIHFVTWQNKKRLLYFTRIATCYEDM